MRPEYATKLIDRASLRELRSGLRAQGLTLAHCHGCFDIVHPGHIRHLREAATLADRLILSITPDRFVNKGPGRPVFDEGLRADNLAALSFVDWVLINDQPTATDLLEELAPDVFVKGAEYATNNDPRFERERDVVERSGGRVVFSGDDVVHSSTALVEALRSMSEYTGPESGLMSLAQLHDLRSSTLASILQRARGKRVLVLSETIIDLYAHCSRPELAQEHPMLSLCPDREDQFDGGGAVIAQHLAAMGLQVTLCTPIGDDPDSLALIERLERSGVVVQPLESKMPLPRKVRYLVDGEKMMKIDSSIRYALDDTAGSRVISHIKAAGGYDAMVIADFGLGLFANKLASRVITGAREQLGMILGDVSGRRAQMGEMRGADVLCPCEVELRQMFDADSEPLAALASHAIEITGAKTLCVTRAAEGMQIYDQHGGKHAMPALCRHPVDVLGCGDALLTAMTAALLGEANQVQAGYIGSLAAAIEGETRGNLPVSSQAILERAQQLAAHLALGHASHAVPFNAEPKHTSTRELIR
ncbi:MAG: PfkB family carbohydrate kinase [Phycisphaerales bacterium JB052]